MNPRGVTPTGLAGRRPGQARRPRLQIIKLLEVISVFIFLRPYGLKLLVNTFFATA